MVLEEIQCENSLGSRQDREEGSCERGSMKGMEYFLINFYSMTAPCSQPVTLLLELTHSVGTREDRLT